MGRRPMMMTLLALGALVASCGSDDASPSASVPTEPTATTESTTAATTTTASATPTAPEVTGPTTASSPTTEPAEPTQNGWTLTDFDPRVYVLYYSGNWESVDGPSPAAPPAGQPPADGNYVATLREPWSPERPDVLAVRVERLERCADLVDVCYEDETPDEYNLDPTWHLDVDVPLDATTKTVVSGFSCWTDGQTKQGSGTDLRDLFEAFTSGFAAVIEPLLDEGLSGFEVGERVAAAPAGGFVGDLEQCEIQGAGLLQFVHDDAPVLLLQILTDEHGDPLTVTDITRLGSVRYAGGEPTWWFYAGFIS